MEGLAKSNKSKRLPLAFSATVTISILFSVSCIKIKNMSAGRVNESKSKSETPLHPSDISLLYPIKSSLSTVEDFHKLACKGMWPRFVQGQQKQILFSPKYLQDEANRHLITFLGSDCPTDNSLRTEDGLISLRDFVSILHYSKGSIQNPAIPTEISEAVIIRDAPNAFKFTSLHYEYSREEIPLSMAEPGRWVVVAARYLPCATKLNSRGCIPELRISSQPLIGFGSGEQEVGEMLPDSGSMKEVLKIRRDVSHPRNMYSQKEAKFFLADYGIHAFYELNETENRDILDQIRKLRDISIHAGCQTEPHQLNIHPCLERALGNIALTSNHGKSANLNQFTANLWKVLHIPKKPATRYAVFSSNKNNTAWSFFTLVRNAQSNELQPAVIPALDIPNFTRPATQSVHDKMLNQRMLMVYSRSGSLDSGNCPKWPSPDTLNGLHEIKDRIFPRPKDHLDSLDFLLRTCRGFQRPQFFRDAIERQKVALQKIFPTQFNDESYLQMIFGGKKIRTKLWADSKVNWNGPMEDLLLSKNALESYGGRAQNCENAQCIYSSPDYGKKAFFLSDIRGLANVTKDLGIQYADRNAIVQSVTKRINDPEINSEFSTDCVSCHMANMEEIATKDTVDQEVLKFNHTKHSFPAFEFESNGMYILNQFSYYKNAPIVSTRVFNETIEQLTFLNN